MAKINKWIDVNERMPEKIGQYLCYTTDRHRIVCFVDMFGNWSAAPFGTFYGDLYGPDNGVERHSKDIREVTHWRDLPAPPVVLTQEVIDRRAKAKIARDKKREAESIKSLNNMQQWSNVITNLYAERKYEERI
jgi:hypothetical protein